MIHYHGTPCGGKREEVARFLAGRHALIPFPRPEDAGTAAEVCSSFVIDNGAYTLWKTGESKPDWKPYMEFVRLWSQHPAFDWAIIPDSIDGDEKENDLLISKWINWDGWKQGFYEHKQPLGESWADRIKRVPGKWLAGCGIPVWHFHESLERLARLAHTWPRICLGSSGDFATVGTEHWHRRMAEVMDAVCIEGRPVCKLHGLRMLDPAIFTAYPLASADSTNAVRNSSSYKRFGMYCPPSNSTRMAIIAERIEAHQSPALWVKGEKQLVLFEPVGVNHE